MAPPHTSGDEEFQAHTSGDEGFQEPPPLSDIELAEEEEAQKSAEDALEVPAPVEKSQPPVIPTSESPVIHGGPPDDFKTRFRPTYDPNVGVFKVTKRIEVADGVYLVGDFIFPSDENIDGRRMRLLFQQRYMDYPTTDEVGKIWKDDKARDNFKAKARQNKKDQLAAEAKFEADQKAKMAEQAKKDRANRAGNVNPVHDQNG